MQARSVVLKRRPRSRRRWPSARARRGADRGRAPSRPRLQTAGVGLVPAIPCRGRAYGRARVGGLAQPLVPVVIADPGIGVRTPLLYGGLREDRLIRSPVP